MKTKSNEAAHQAAELQKINLNGLELTPKMIEILKNFVDSPFRNYQQIATGMITLNYYKESVAEKMGEEVQITTDFLFLIENLMQFIYEYHNEKEKNLSFRLS